MRVFVCQKIITFIIRMFILMLSCVLFLLNLTCSIFITSWILKFCTLISAIIIFWSVWLIAFLITCLIMIMKQILIMQILDSRVVAQLIFFIMWFLLSSSSAWAQCSHWEAFLSLSFFLCHCFSSSCSWFS